MSVFVITGATSGLGLETARSLAAGGGQVVLAVRDERRGRSVAAELPGGPHEVVPVDLADLNSVRTCAARVRAGRPRLDGLINNAGVMGPPRTLSAQGHELQFAVNHLAHFALTGLLLDLLSGGRVVTVSSTLHRKGKIVFDERYDPQAAYNRSKLANALFGLELHRRLTAAGSTTSSLLAHPGYSRTALQGKLPPGFQRFWLTRIGNPLIATTAAEGARPAVYAATAADARSGQFIGPGGLGELRGAPRPVEPSAEARDPATARRLWDLSEEWTGVSYALPV